MLDCNDDYINYFANYQNKIQEKKIKDKHNKELLYFLKHQRGLQRKNLDFTLAEKNEMLLKDDDKIKETLLNNNIKLKKDLVNTDNFFADHSNVAINMMLIDLFISREKIVNLYRENIQTDIKIDIMLGVISHKKVKWNFKL